MQHETIVTIITSVSSLLVGIFGVHFWNLLKEKNNNATKIDLKKLENESESTHAAAEQSKDLIQKLTEQNTTLLKEVATLEKKVQELRIIVERTMASFEMLMLLMKETFKDNATVVEALETVYKHVKQATFDENIHKMVKETLSKENK